MAKEIKVKDSSQIIDELKKEISILNDRYKDIELCEYCKYPEAHCECEFCATCGAKRKAPESCATCEEDKDD